MSIKQLTIEEFNANITVLRELFKLSFNNSFKDISFEEEFYDSKIKQAEMFLKVNNAIILGYFSDENLCAFAYLYETFIYGKKYLHLNHIAVLPTYQHKGIAKQLFQEIYQLAKTNNIDAIKLDVSDTNVVAKSLYQKEGFNVTRLQMEKYLL